MRILIVAIVAALSLTSCVTRGDETSPVAANDGIAKRSDADTADDVISLEVVGTPVDLPERFFGFNAASIVSPVNVERMVDPELWDALADFPTRLIRIPSGTAAQWIDWRSGRFIDLPGSPFADAPDDRPGVTMADWAALVKATGAEPVWDLNVLNSTIDDQIEMLTEAERSGMPVRLIELGNELWDVRGPYMDKFPTGAAYAEQMNEWISRLRERFPDIRIGVSGSDPADATLSDLLGDRYTRWNKGVLSTIGDADAIVVHQYWGLPNNAAPGSDVDATLTAGLDHWSDMQDLTFDGLDLDMDVWITEWNQAAHFAPSGTQIWAQALSVALVAMEHALDPRVTISLVHNIIDGTGNPHDIGPSMVYPSFTNGENGTDPFGRTPLGLVLPLIFGAAAGNTSVQRLATAPSTTAQTSGAPGPSGVVFDGDRTEVVIANTSDTVVTVRLPRHVADLLGPSPTSIEIHADPEAAPGWQPGTRVATDITRLKDVSDAQVLPAFSVTRITGAGS